MKILGWIFAVLITLSAALYLAVWWFFGQLPH